MPVVMRDNNFSQPRVAHQAPASKRPKIDMPCDIAGALRMKWSVTNREDYHPPLIRQPYGVAINSNVIVTAEGLWPHSRLHILDHNGRSVKAVGQGDILPYGVSLAADGKIVASDHRSRSVKFFNQDGKVLLEWPNNKFRWPNGIAHTPTDKLVITDWSKGQVSTCDVSGTIVSTFQTTTDTSEQLSCPDHVAVDTHGRIVLSDAFTGSVKIFCPAGRILQEFGCNAGPGRVLIPKGVSTDRSDNIVVTDWEGNVIKLYSSDGEWIKDLVTAAGGLRHPCALECNKHNNDLVVTEHKLNCSPFLKLFGID